MSVRSNVSWDEFLSGELLREVFWRGERFGNDAGVILYCSNDHSDRTARVADWAVYFMKGAKPG